MKKNAPKVEKKLTISRETVKNLKGKPAKGEAQDQGANPGLPSPCIRCGTTR